MGKKKEKKPVRKTVVIFGISSFLGSNLAEFLKKDYRVVGTYHNTPINLPGILTLPCDVLNKDEVQLVLFAFRPDIAIYAVGEPSVKVCDEYPDVADALNTAGLINVTEYCQRYKSQICYISSCFVFGGENKDYIEMDIPDSNTMYGKTMASSEFYIQKTSLNYIIFRTCRLYGRSVNPKRPTWFEILQRKLKEGRSFTCDSKVHSGFLDVQYLAMLLDICFKKEATNRLFQVSSSDSSDFYTFSKEYCNQFGEPEGLLLRGGVDFPVISNSSGQSIGEEELHYQMDITNIEGYLNIKLPSIAESLKFTSQRLFGGEEKEGMSEDVTFI